MDREILFRGKDYFSNEWVEGTPVFYKDKAIIIEPKLAVAELPSFGWVQYEVIPKTVTQFTGLCDKNGTKIFEGDLVYFCDANHDEEDGAMQVVYKDCQFVIEGSDICVQMSETRSYELEVIGNIFNNKELMIEN